MPRKEYLTEQIKYHTELLRLAWILLLAVGGGTVSLALGELDTRRGTAMVGGSVIVVILGIGLLYLDRRVRTFIGSLKEG